MKIIGAKVQERDSGRKYSAEVTILDEGVQIEGEAFSDDPTQAVQAALSVAIKTRSDQLREALVVDMRVRF